MIDCKSAISREVTANKGGQKYGKNMRQTTAVAGYGRGDLASLLMKFAY
jgi:hypothetical protein